MTEKMPEIHEKTEKERRKIYKEWHRMGEKWWKNNKKLAKIDGKRQEKPKNGGKKQGRKWRKVKITNSEKFLKINGKRTNKIKRVKIAGNR